MNNVMFDKFDYDKEVRKTLMFSSMTANKLFGRE